MQLKSYTDIEQSKKLAEILPTESADMFWLVIGNTPRAHVLTESLNNYSKWESYPCWSLTALLSILPETITSNEGIAFELNIKKNIIEYSNPSLYLIYKSVKSDNPVDACYEMILKLHELKML